MSGRAPQNAESRQGGKNGLNIDLARDDGYLCIKSDFLGGIL